MSTVAAWMAYALVVSALVTGAALLAERAARAAGRSARGLWAGALGVTMVLPVAAWLWPSSAAAPVSEVPVSMLRIQPIVLDAATSGSALPVDGILLGLWAVLSVLCGAFVAVAAMRLARARRTWERAELEGQPVLLSDDVGPAVVGLARGEIVMPRWTLAIERDLRRLLLLHEREHVLAGDPRLLFAGLAALVLAPWNPFVWIQFLRLRLAIEIDCDARVLHASRDARSYGALLLEVGRYRTEPALAVAFGEPRRFLEERIRMIPRALGRRHPRRAAGLALGAVAVLLLAVCARDPMSSADPTERAGVLEAQVEEQADVSQAPVFTPFTVAPKIRNAEETRRRLEENYPPLLREAGIGGTTLVWFFVDEAGRVQKVQINKSAGYDALDQAALRVAAEIDFAPALNQEKPVPVWIAIPIVFQAGEGEARATQLRKQATDTTSEGRELDRRDRLEAMRAAQAEAEALGKSGVEPSPEVGPQFTPFTDRPELLNRPEVQEALETNYPPLLRNAGIGGQTMVWFLIDKTGAVSDVRLNKSSDHPALDEAALKVARVMRFSPAKNRGAAVPVWVAIPIVFSSK